MTSYLDFGLEKLRECACLLMLSRTDVTGDRKLVASTNPAGASRCRPTGPEPAVRRVGGPSLEQPRISQSTL